jgi:hypothetical protein
MTGQTYRDGVGIARCGCCGVALRSLDDAPLTALRLEDAEVITLLVADAIDRSMIEDPTDDVTHVAGQKLLGRLQEACGRSVTQLRGAAS